MRAGLMGGIARTLAAALESGETEIAGEAGDAEVRASYGQSRGTRVDGEGCRGVRRGLMG